jgi:hypothetical protein
MRQPTLPGIVQRRFVHCVAHHGEPVDALVARIGAPPGDLCRLIAGQQIARLPLTTFERIARWLRMPLANVTALAGHTPALAELVRLGMTARGYRPTGTRDQIAAAGEAGISVAVFRRALHGYADFRPTMRTCDRLAAWLDWTGYNGDDIARATGLAVRYRAGGRRITVAAGEGGLLAPYPCACGRPGCMVPAHIPQGPRRKWRSDACRMWARRRARRAVPAAATAGGPCPTPIDRFIAINERLFPVRS